jgi:ribosomal silencing factor RsfS
MEIISTEMSKQKRSLLSTKEGDDNDDEDEDDYDNLDLNTIPEYKDFRAMVLDDYYQELTKMKQQKEHRQVTTTDWKDFDTRVALQTEFATSDINDNSSNNSDNEEVVAPTSSVIADDTLDNTIDWLHARRSRLGDTNNNNNNNRNSSPDKDNNNNSSNKTPTQLLTPGQAEVFQHQNSHIPIHMYTLFTTSELSMSLLAQGGTDIHIINTFSNHQQHDNSTGSGGVGIGCDYILLCTGRNPSHIRVMADSIVRNLKLRKLHERNVLGALHGIEGGQDIFSNKRSRNRARKLGGGGPGSSGKMDDDWIVIDCDNIHVHILDDVTRKCLNIESLWDLSNPNSEGSKLRRINLSDDDAMDEYVTQNPIPDEYAIKLFNYSSSSDCGGRGRDGWFTGGAGSRVQTVLSSYKRKSFSDKWNGKGSSSSGGGAKKGRRRQRAKSVR